TLSVQGKTIMPGLIDAHAHGAQGTNGLVPEQNWSAIAHLALGVTTIHDPSSQADHIFSAAQMQAAGLLLAPRIFSTGEIIYGAKAPGFFANIQKLDDAKEHITRLKAQGAHSIKNYNQPRREQRQQVVTAAREAGMVVVAEGGSLFHMDLSMVSDGNTGIEHNLPQSELYDDVIQFYGQSDVGYTPTLIVTYGGVRGEDYYYQHSDVWKHPILSKFVPPHVLQPRSVRRQMAPESDYVDATSAATAKKLADAGVRVSIGAHGQREGLGSHWEMWSFVRGGMSPLEAIKTATITPAQHLGYAKDIGSLEVGKLADLIIMDKNPLEDIRNTDKISYVMIGGRLYHADTMQETLSGNHALKPSYWE
ncbi:MAG TPA: amidohydrolase, partial [Hellea balneolensis]|nr:amidohydrolase [Hellea balneolensis]